MSENSTRHILSGANFPRSTTSLFRLCSLGEYRLGESDADWYDVKYPFHAQDGKLEVLLGKLYQHAYGKGDFLIVSIRGDIEDEIRVYAITVNEYEVIITDTTVEYDVALFMDGFRTTKDEALNYLEQTCSLNLNYNTLMNNEVENDDE